MDARKLAGSAEAAPLPPDDTFARVVYDLKTDTNPGTVLGVQAAHNFIRLAQARDPLAFEMVSRVANAYALLANMCAGADVDSIDELLRTLRLEGFAERMRQARIPR